MDTYLRARPVAALGLLAILAVACGTTDAAQAQPLAGASPASISLGQADPANMGGTHAPAPGTSLGQADPANMGGTQAPAAGTSLGQADPANMGGTHAPAAGTSLGQADPANMGGTRAPAAGSPQ